MPLRNVFFLSKVLVQFFQQSSAHDEHGQSQGSPLGWMFADEGGRKWGSRFFRWQTLRLKAKLELSALSPCHRKTMATCQILSTQLLWFSRKIKRIPCYVSLLNFWMVSTLYLKGNLKSVIFCGRWTQCNTHVSQKFKLYPVFLSLCVYLCVVLGLHVIYVTRSTNDKALLQLKNMFWNYINIHL